MTAVRGLAAVETGPDPATAALAGAAAVTCPSWQHQGAESDHRRLLARIRRAMPAGAVLVLEQPPPDAATLATHDPLTGRSGGVRLYQATELAALARAAGYAVERMELTGPPGVPVPGLRLFARPLPVPPAALAVTAWGEEVPAPSEGPGAGVDPAVRLDLRYADDEAELLSPPPDRIWAEVAGADGRFGVAAAEHYPVDDPFGGRRGADVVARHFNLPITADRLFFGAGVTGLLRDLAGLAEGGRVLAPAQIHPDLPAWAMRSGAEIRLVAEPAGSGALHAAIAAVRPALLHLDRPSYGGTVHSLDEIASLAREVPAVVVDESAAPYLGSLGSAVQLTGRVSNLVVLRGFTKAYSWGGLRAGFAVASPGITERVRELITPMQISGPALRAVLGVLAAGDVLGPLRARIRLVKEPFARQLTAAGLTVVRGHPDIPWVVVRDNDGGATRFLARRGIRGLLPSPVPAPPGAPAAERLLHLTVPLSDRRIALFRKLFGGPLQPPAR